MLPRVLTIAGSDCSGGAGIEADLKVITAHKCYGMTAMTGLTAQNTMGVIDIHPVPSEFLRKAITAIMDDIGVDVVKTGMLTSAESITVVARAIQNYKLTTVVLDPVMISTSGSSLLPPNAIAVLCNDLIPLATLITPNIPEAQHLLSYYLSPSEKLSNPPTSEPITSMGHVVDLARKLQEQTGTAVLVKGGHVPFGSQGAVARRPKDRVAVIDVLVSTDGSVKIFNSQYIDSKNTHGTGCSLASAIACNLALSQPLPTAITNARNYVAGAIATSFAIGFGNGPINHVHNLYTLPYSKGHFFKYLITHPKVATVWDEYVNHEFVKRIANGTVGEKKFGWYLRQDYLFLIHFARAASLMAYKATKLPLITLHTSTVAGINRETELHVKYCESFGITREDIESTPEAPSTTTYTRYVLDIGMSSDEDALAVALISCAVGYQVAARNREQEDESVNVKSKNKFWGWVEEYAGEGYAEIVDAQRARLEDAAMGLSLKKVEQLVEIFRRVTEMERDFFTAALLAEP